MNFFAWLSSLELRGLIIISLTILAIVGIFVLKKWTIRIGSAQIGPGPKEQRPSKILLEHDFFINQAAIIWGEFSLTIANGNKKVLIETFYRHMCRTAYDAMQNFVKGFEDGKKEPVEILGILTEIIAEHNQKAKTLEIKLPSGTVLCGVPARLLDIFDHWNDPHVELIQQKCLDVIKSDFHSDERSKLISILDAIDIGYRITLLDLTNSADEMNGQLEAAIADAVCKETPDA